MLRPLALLDTIIMRWFTLSVWYLFTMYTGNNYIIYIFTQDYKIVFLRIRTQINRTSTIVLYYCMIFVAVFIGIFTRMSYIRGIVVFFILGSDLVQYWCCVLICLAILSSTVLGTVLLWRPLYSQSCLKYRTGHSKCTSKVR